jgi:hypothetical protein
MRDDEGGIRIGFQIEIWKFHFGIFFLFACKYA